jgi:hypothetical protein
MAIKTETQDPNRPYGLHVSLAFFLTNMVEGKNRGVVIKTGDDKVLGSRPVLDSKLDWILVKLPSTRRSRALST